MVEHQQHKTSILRWLVKISLEDANEKIVIRFNFSKNGGSGPPSLKVVIIITGWLTRWSTRNMKIARASRENGFDSVPAQFQGRKHTNKPITENMKAKINNNRNIIRNLKKSITKDILNKSVKTWSEKGYRFYVKATKTFEVITKKYKKMIIKSKVVIKSAEL